MSTATLQTPLPLDEVMLAMDVVDTLRHNQDLVERELDGAARERRMIERLREIYRQQGIDVPDHVLQQGVDALAEQRFAYAPPASSLGTTLARLYVGRGRWGRWVLGIGAAILLIAAGYAFAYRPYQASQAEQARIELAEGLPGRMDALYDVIYEETKVQTAVEQAQTLVERGKIAAREGDREGALDAIDRLTAIRDTLRQEYTLRVVNREGEQSGIWTFPEVNTDATNYYIIVEALDPRGQPQTLPIANEETGESEMATAWGVRVPLSVYEAIAADKLDDGIIQRDVIGTKQYGFLDVDYVVPVMGGAITRW